MSLVVCRCLVKWVVDVFLTYFILLYQLRVWRSRQGLRVTLSPGAPVPTGYGSPCKTSCPNPVVLLTVSGVHLPTRSLREILGHWTKWRTSKTGWVEVFRTTVLGKTGKDYLTVEDPDLRPRPSLLLNLTPGGTQGMTGNDWDRGLTGRPLVASTSRPSGT